MLPMYTKRSCDHGAVEMLAADLKLCDFLLIYTSHNKVMELQQIIHVIQSQNKIKLMISIRIVEIRW